MKNSTALLRAFSPDPHRQKLALLLIARGKELRGWREYRVLKGALMRLQARGGRVVGDELKRVNGEIYRAYRPSRRRPPPREVCRSPCGLCGKVFVDRPYLRRHLFRAHELSEAIGLVAVRRTVRRNGAKVRGRDGRVYVYSKVYLHVEAEAYLPDWVDGRGLATSEVRYVRKKRTGERWAYYRVGEVRVQQRLARRSFFGEA